MRAVGALRAPSARGCRAGRAEAEHLVGSYQLVRSMLRRDDLDTFRRSKGARALRDPYLTRLTHSPRDITLIDGDDHTRFHQKGLACYHERTASDGARLASVQIVHHVIDRFAPKGRAELATEFAAEVPIRVTASVLGLPWEDDDWINSTRAFLDAKEEYLDALLDPRENREEIGRELRLLTAYGTVERLKALRRASARRQRSGRQSDQHVCAGWPRHISRLGNGRHACRHPDRLLRREQDHLVCGGERVLTCAVDAPGASGRPACRGARPLASAFVEESLRILGVTHFQNRDG